MKRKETNMEDSRLYQMTTPYTHLHTPISQPFVQDYPGEPVPER